jgi:NRPS condensation-like uncharacterized protein
MKAVPLSPVDYIFTGAGSQPVTFAFSYRVTMDPNVLRNSLQKTLAHFPVLRSQLQRIFENDLEFRIAEDGLTFEVIESALAFEESGRIEQYITPVSSLEGNPLTKITLTQTPTGSILAVSISHALVDGFSYFHFLSSWARICRGDRILPPELDRTAFFSKLKFSPKTVTADSFYAGCGLFYGGKRAYLRAEHVNEERFFISDETLRSCLEDARKEHNVSLTENDAVMALLWKKYIPAWSKENGNPPTYITCPFDFRRVLTDFPKNYFGCALCFATASIDMQ